MRKFLLTSLISLFAFSVVAAPSNIKQWKVEQGSKIEFFVTQNNSQISGEFKEFVAEIFFDGANLAKSSAKVEIDLNSLVMSYSDAIPTARSKDWLDIKSFPKATFRSKKFNKISAEKFHVDGFLSIKGKELPFGFDFTFKENSSKKSAVNAEFALSRSSFGVGVKDEKSANGVKDLVTIKLLINAITQ